MKILFDHSIFLHQCKGGISKYICNLNNELNKKKVNSYIFAPISINDHLQNQKNKINFIKLKKIPKGFTKIFYAINNLLTILYIFLKQPDVIHLTYYNNHLSKIYKRKYYLTVHDLIYEQYFKNFKNKLPIINSKFIFCISKNTEKNLNKIYKIKNTKTSVIYHGSKHANKTNLKRENTILFVGGRSRYKNFKLFAKAYSISKKINNNFGITVLGPDPFSIDEINFLRKLKIEKKVNYFNADDISINKFYRKCALLVYPSNLEGFGLPPLEAMTEKCPVVLSNINVHKEIYKNCAIFFKRNNLSDLKKQIENSLFNNKLRKKLIDNGYKLSKKLSWDKVVLKYIKNYKNFI